MTNLLISFPDIPYNVVDASDITASSQDSSYLLENTILGGRDTEWRTAASVTSSTLDYDYTTTRNADHMILTRAHRFTEKGVAGDPDFTLYADDNAGFTTPESQTESVATIDLVGPNGEDYINYFSTGFTTDYQYFRVEVDSGTDSYVHKYSNIYFGNFFDFGRDPSSPVALQRVYSMKYRVPKYEIALTWEGVTNAKRNEFIDKIGDIADIAPVFLYEQTDCFLGGFSLLHCWIVDYACVPVTSQTNTIIITFEEVT